MTGAAGRPPGQGRARPCGRPSSQRVHGRIGPKRRIPAGSHGSAPSRDRTLVLVAGLDGEQDLLAVADRPAQEDESLVHQAVHERGVRRPPAAAPGAAAPGPRTAP